MKTGEPVVLTPAELVELEKELNFIDGLICRNVIFALSVKAARAYLDLRTEVNDYLNIRTERTLP